MNHLDPDVYIVVAGATAVCESENLLVHFCDHDGERFLHIPRPIASYLRFLAGVSN
jgi:hypothetical protein